MANTKFEYVKQFEQDDSLLPGCWIVVRLDGKGFTRFTTSHNFEKPSDARGLDLMDAAAVEVMRTFPDIRIAFGESDEYSFVFHKSSKLYGRRSSKLVSLVTSCFTGSYVRTWPSFFPDTELTETPLFDGRAVLYPTDLALRDYLSWRQADTHINCQYNTCYWALVKGGKSPAEAQDTLKGTQADFKNELLFSSFGINYNELPPQFRKGSTVIRAPVLVKQARENGSIIEKEIVQPVVMYVDIIREPFWQQHPEILR